MEKCYAVISQKGGVGKTTTSVALATGLARRKKKTLLIDLDQQGDSTHISNIAPELISYTVSDVINKKCTPQDAIQKTAAGYDIIPTTDNGLAELTFEVKLKAPIKKIVSIVAGDYDYVILDCPPNIYNITTEALIAADEVVFTGLSDSLSIRSFNNLMESIADVRDMKNKKLHMAGILLTKYDQRRKNLNNAARNDYQILADTYGTKIFETVIPESVTICEAWWRRESIYEYIDDAKGNANAAILAYDKWITELTGVKSKEGKKSGKAETGAAGIRIKSRRSGNPKNGRRATRTRGKGRPTASRKKESQVKLSL